jgi:NAD+ synthase
MSQEEKHKKIVKGLRAYFGESGFKQGVLGLSGGLDSAVVLKLAVDSLGAENVSALIMPESGLTSAENINHAKGLSDFFGVKYYQLPINPFLVDFATLPWKQKDIAYVNTKARVRGLLLYNFANTFNALVIGTSNKSELLLGYGTKYGDLASDVMPIGDMYKTEVYELADFMGLPEEIINKPPSAELYEGQTDEEELGGKYKEIDNILEQRDLGESALVDKGMNALLVRSVFRRMEENQHKLEPPVIIKAG